MQDRTTCVLILDDDQQLLDVYSRYLARAGYRCIPAQTGEVALERLKSDAVDVVISDLTLPGMTGMEFMRRARERDPDLPILVVTGAPGVESAIQSIEAGVFRYVRKPVSPPELARVVSEAVHARALALARRAAYTHIEQTRPGAPTPEMFRRALDTLWLAAQPIVCPAKRSVVAYEVLLRTRDPDLRDPMSLLSAAEQLGLLPSVGRAVRAAAAELVPKLPDGVLLFVNLHPRDLLDEDLYRRSAPLSMHAHRVVLEITERSSLEEVPDSRTRVAELKDLGFQVALDDMGAGYAGLSSFAFLRPTFVKIDLSLVRGVDSDPVRQSLIRAITNLSKELDLQVIAEGVETDRERATLIQLGCGLLQGYFFARPGPPFPDVSWP